MSGLLYFTAEDFAVQKGTKGNIMCHSVPGFCLVLFYSTACSHCQSLIPIFKSMPGTIGGCQFGMINIGNNKKCIEMAKATIAPITYVPYIVLYINGKPFMVYQGDYKADEIRNFIIEVANNVQKKQQFTGGRIKQDSIGGGSIPAYTIGQPLCGGKVCYLDFGQAYKN